MNTVGGAQRGGVTVEFAVFVPLLVLLFGLVIGGARVWLAQLTVEQMSSAAARGASQARSPAVAVQRAEQLAIAQAAVGGLRCSRLGVTVDAGALNVSAGSPGRVTARVVCAVPLADVLVPGWPGTVDVGATAVAVIDRYRGRQ